MAATVRTARPAPARRQAVAPARPAHLPHSTARTIRPSAPTKPTDRAASKRATRSSRSSGAVHRPADSTPLRRVQQRIVARPRLAINAALVLVGVVVALMLAAVVLHTRLAERQVEIDRVETAVVEARGRFDVLRQQRAELRAPNRLLAVATEMGMIQAPAADFLPVDPATLARVLVASGPVDGSSNDIDEFAPLDQIRRIKAAADE